MPLIDAYHGTDASLVPVILSEGFRASVGDDHWLGDGTYFFVEGTSGADPQGAAVKWGIAEAYDKRQRSLRYRDYAVMHCRINATKDNLWDLTTVEGMKLFNKLRNGFMRKIAESDYVPRKSVDFKDGHLINLGRRVAKLPFTLVKGNFYIKFKVERMNNIFFRLPNCTILAVLNPAEQVEPGSVSCVVKKEII